MSLSSRLWRIFEGLFDRWYSGAIHKKKAPGQGATSSMAMFSLLAFLVLALKRYR